MKYVGIESSVFKTKLRRKWKLGKIRKIKTKELVAKDCNRHLEVLSLFDKIEGFSGKLFKETLYYNYQKLHGKSHKSVMRKIKIFYKLYRNIQEYGYDYSKGYIKVTVDGARIDGSHRSSILFHLGIHKIKIVMLDWRIFFSNREIKPFLNHLCSQKKLFGG